MVAASQSEFGQRVEQQKALKLFRFDTESGKAVSGTAKISPANNGGCTLYYISLPHSCSLHSDSKLCPAFCADPTSSVVDDCSMLVVSR